MRNDGKPRDVPGIVLSVLFIALGAWVWSESEAMTPLGSVFPRTISTVMIVCAVALIGMNLLRRPGSRARPEAERESTPRRLALVAVMALWVVLIPVMGFFTASVLAFVAILAAANYDSLSATRMAAYGAAAVGIVAVFYLLMVKVLLVPVPRGMLF